MNRLAWKLGMDIQLLQSSRMMLNSEGTCACGRVLTTLTPKFILINAVPSLGQMAMAAYCSPCSQRINRVLKNLHKSIYGRGTETAPVEINKKVI